MTSDEAEAPENIPGKPYEGRFAAWLLQARKSVRATQEEIATRTGLSESWISRIETGDGFPNAVDRDKIILGIDFDQTTEAVEAWLADRKQIDRADTKGQHPHAQYRSREERRALGEEQRMKVLRIVAEDLILRAMAPMASMIGGRMNITVAGTQRHIRQLVKERLLLEERFSSGTAHLRLTPQGLAKVLRWGEATGEWTPPFDQAAPELRALTEYLLVRGECGPLSPPPPPPPAQHTAPSGSLFVLPFTKGGPVDALADHERRVLWLVATTYPRGRRVVSLQDVAAGTGLSLSEAAESARKLLADELLLCDHAQDGGLLPSQEGARWMVASGWPSAALPPAADDGAPPGEGPLPPSPAPPAPPDVESDVLAWLRAASVPATEEEIAAGLGVDPDDIYAACEALLDGALVSFSKKTYTYEAVRR